MAVGGNPGTYSGNPQYCADAAGTGGGTPNPEAGGGSVVGLFTKSGTGDTVFDLPTRVTRIHIEGTFTGRSSSFIVRIGGNSTVVNDILGTAIQRTGFAGTYFIAGGGAVEITRSTGALWTFTEIP